jgi:hypothetical protein
MDRARSVLEESIYEMVRKFNFRYFHARLMTQTRQGIVAKQHPVSHGQMYYSLHLTSRN